MSYASSVKQAWPSSAHLWGWDTQQTGLVWPSGLGRLLSLTDLEKTWKKEQQEMKQTDATLPSTTEVVWEISENQTFLQGSNDLMVCRQFQETVHHSFNSWFWSAPVIRNRQKGTLERRVEGRLKQSDTIGHGKLKLVCHYSLGILPLVVITKKKAREWPPSVRPQLMKTPRRCRGKSRNHRSSIFSSWKLLKPVL